VVYCESCKAVLYKGDDQNFISRVVTNQVILRHLEAFSDDHVVEIVFVRRKDDRTLATF